MGDERSAEGSEKDAGCAMVDPLAADPHPLAGKVEPDEPLTVYPWRLHG